MCGIVVLTSRTTCDTTTHTPTTPHTMPLLLPPPPHKTHTTSHHGFLSTPIARHCLTRPPLPPGPVPRPATVTGTMPRDTLRVISRLFHVFLGAFMTPGGGGGGGGEGGLGKRWSMKGREEEDESATRRTRALPQHLPGPVRPESTADLAPQHHSAPLLSPATLHCTNTLNLNLRSATQLVHNLTLATRHSKQQQQQRKGGECDTATGSANVTMNPKMFSRSGTPCRGGRQMPGREGGPGLTVTQHHPSHLLTPVTAVLPEADQDVGAAEHLLSILQQGHEGLLAALGKVHQPQIQSPAHHHSLPHHTGLFCHLELKAQPNAATLSSRYHFSTLRSGR
ncbi:hypothetical protein E2C01_022868 [Portunus trituberculatus]|uniref:Uncharacterized protein n=1 Tax=Portunus trituberculatus TaxID=210409 RepID=A0A5B7E8H0_PORTR|nr:hypothetical protein [Portunus trituberculatus]